jgi:hypothetical protein
MCSHAMMPGVDSNILLMFIIKIIFLLMGFACLLVMLVRQREMIKVLKEIRDKK